MLIPRERYPRFEYAPYSVEFILKYDEKGNLCVVTPCIDFCTQNDKKNDKYNQYFFCQFLVSVYTNNATYVFGRDWEMLSKLSKAEILDGKLQEARLIHNDNWKHHINELLEV